MASQLSEAQAQRLIKLYSQAEKEILNELNKALLKGNSTDNLKTMLANVRAIRKDLLAGSRTWCQEAIPTIYIEGMKEAGLGTVTSIGRIHQQAMSVLAENTYQRLIDVDQVIGRRTEDIYRNLALESVRGDAAGYQTWKQVAQNYKQKLADQGVTGFRDAAGRDWDMSRYSEMVARTTTRETMNQGTSNRLIENGYDLAKVQGGASSVTCEHCKAWVGRVFSLTGKTKGYLSMEEVKHKMPDGSEAKHPHLFGPNCTHTFSLATDAELERQKAEEES